MYEAWLPTNSEALPMRPPPDTSPTLTIPVAFALPEARDEFKRLLDHNGSTLEASGWGELLLIGDRVVVKNLAPGAEPSLRSTLDQLQRLAETRASESAELHDASRRELLDAVLEQSRVRVAALRFRPAD
jgi:hypothetical protein